MSLTQQLYAVVLVKAYIFQVTFLAWATSILPHVYTFIYFIYLRFCAFENGIGEKGSWATDVGNTIC